MSPAKAMKSPGGYPVIRSQDGEVYTIAPFWSIQYSQSYVKSASMRKVCSLFESSFWLCSSSS